MATAATENERAAQQSCWCCDNTFDESDLTALGAHPEVRVCAGCAHWLHRRARAAADRELRTPGAWLRRVLGTARGRVMRAGAHDWPVVGALLRRLDRHLP